MFLNYRRASSIYIALSVLTLGLYSAYFRREIASDLNTAFGEKRQELPAAKFVILNILTFGIYATLWDIEFMKLCGEYIEQNGKEPTADLDTYRFFGMIPIVRFWALSNLINEINLFCKIYSDKQLEDVSVDDLVGVNRVRKTTENVDEIYSAATPTREIDLDFSAEIKENKMRSINEREETYAERKSVVIAGHVMVEEYDPSKDQRRIGYEMRFARENAISEKEEELKRQEEAERLEKEREEALKNNRVREVVDCRRNKRWLAKTITLLIIVFLLPFAAVAVTVFVLPPVYDETYMGALADKYELLKETEGKRIIIIGGSSATLGLDSNILENDLRDYNIVNFGLSSELGIKAMLDISKSGIRDDDIIIIAPEMSDLGMSLHFNGEAMLRALDGNPELLLHIESEDYQSLIGSSLDFTCNKIGYLVSKSKPQNTRPAYAQSNINEYGDNIYTRPYNETFGAYSTVRFDYRAELDDTTVTEYERFIQYVNEYTHFAERKGAKVYYSFAPICKAAISDDETKGTVNSYYSNLCEVLQCKVISDINNYIFDEIYFYDNEFNLNDAGVKLRSIALLNDIKRTLKNDSQNSVSNNTLAGGFPPINEALQTQEDIDNAAFFEFKPIYIMSAGEEKLCYAVSGLSESGKQAAVLTVPNIYSGSPVIGIEPKAFIQSKTLKTLYLGINISYIKEYAFTGSAIEAVYIPDGILPSDITAPGAGRLVTQGCNPYLKFYVKEQDLQTYKNDLGFWEYYKEYIAKKP